MKRKKILFSLLLITSICFFCSTNAFALGVDREWMGEKPEWAPEFNTSVSFLSKYIWRGQNLGDRPVMQLDTSVSMWGLTLDWWSNYSLNSNKEKDDGRYQEFTEMDYAIDYTFNIGDTAKRFGSEGIELLNPVNISAGYTYYTFPYVDWKDKYFDSHEVYLGCSYDILLQPFFTWYWDVGNGKGAGDGGDGSYFLFGISHTVDFGESGIAATAGLTAGYNDEQWTDKSGWSDMVISGEVSIPLFHYFTITPNAAVSIILDKDTYNGDQSSEFYGGVTIGFSY